MRIVIFVIAQQSQHEQNASKARWYCFKLNWFQQALKSIYVIILNKTKKKKRKCSSQTYSKVESNSRCSTFFPLFILLDVGWAITTTKKKRWKINYTFIKMMFYLIKLILRIRYEMEWVWDKQSFFSSLFKCNFI